MSVLRISVGSNWNSQTPNQLHDVLKDFEALMKQNNQELFKIRSSKLDNPNLIGLDFAFL